MPPRPAEAATVQGISLEFRFKSNTKAAREQLAAMGPVSDDEKIFGAVMMCIPAVK